MCEEILVDQIICDECFRISNYNKKIKIQNINIPKCSTISGTVDVAVLQCKPIIKEDCLCAEIELFIQKELLITTPENQKIPLELGFKTTETVCFEKCSLCILRELDPCLFNNLECRVNNLIIKKDVVTLHPSSETTPASFDELLKIELQLMLIHKRRISLMFCPVEPPHPPKECCYPVRNCSYGYNANYYRSGHLSRTSKGAQKSQYIP